MRYALILLALLLSGCATGRTTVAIVGEVDEVQVEVRYEVGGKVAK